MTHKELTISRIAQLAEKDLQAYVKEKGSTFPNIINFLAEYSSRTPATRCDLTRVDTVLPANNSFYKTLHFRSAKILRVDYGTPTAESILSSERSSEKSVLRSRLGELI